MNHISLYRGSVAEKTLKTYNKYTADQLTANQKTVEDNDITDDFANLPVQLISSHPSLSKKPDQTELKDVTSVLGA